MKLNFTASTVAFDRYERCSKKNYQSSRIQTQQPNVNVLSKKKWQVITQGKDFWCNTTSKTLLVKLLSQYLKEDGNTIVNKKDDADKHIGEPASVFECEKKMLLYLQKAHTYTILYILKKEIGEIFMKADSKKHETQKLVSITKVVEKSSRYLFYL